MFAAFSVGFELSPGLRRALKALLKKIQGPTRPLTQALLKHWN